MVNQSNIIRLDQPQVDALRSGADGGGMLDTLKLVLQRTLEMQKKLQLNLAPTVYVEGMAPPITETGSREISDAHWQIKDRLNCLLEGSRAQLTPNGNFLITKKVPPFVHEPDVIERNFQRLNMEKTNGVLEEINIESWEAYLADALARVEYEKAIKGRNREVFSRDDAHASIAGFAGEILLQEMLRRMEAETFDYEERPVELLHEDREFSFPITSNERQYRPVFTTPYNCEVHVSEKNKRGWRMTEFDAVLLSGLEPDSKKYSRLYAFDATLDSDTFCDKMDGKDRILKEFIHAMDSEGLQVHMFNVLFHRGDSPSENDCPRVSESGRVHSITMPLLNTANGISRLMIDDLTPYLDEIFPKSTKANRNSSALYSASPTAEDLRRARRL